VLLALTLAGGGGLYLEIDRNARQARLTREVNEALNQAVALRQKEPARAREQAQRAQALAESGPADVELLGRVRGLLADLDEEQRDGALVTALDRAFLAQTETLSANRFASERALPRFREAFAAYGLVPGEGAPADAAARLRARPPAVRDTALAALEEWV